LLAHQQSKFDDRIVLTPLPPDRDSDRDDRDNEKTRDELATEPVVTLAAIEHDFEACETNRDERDTDTVDPQLAAAPRLTAFLGELRRVLDQPARLSSA
jgi:hypothetical protein